MYSLAVTLTQKFALLGTPAASTITLHPSAFSQVTWENSAMTGVEAQEKHLFSNLLNLLKKKYPHLESYNRKKNLYSGLRIYINF